jgi:aspartate kinase
MALIVQKYGGSSVANIECIEFVAKKIAAHQESGHQIVVVVSAMYGETDRLDKLARQISKHPSPRELDVLLATGEQTSVALLTMALQKLGCKAKSFLGHQIPIITDDAYSRARIFEIGDKALLEAVHDNYIAVVAGFQGVDPLGNLTTLGRGGSDTTAVALAARLKALECQIYTDVDGVYTTDPRIVPNARKLNRITFEEMLELASQGAKVLQLRSVEFAGKYNVPLRVLSTFKEGSGTLIVTDLSDVSTKIEKSEGSRNKMMEQAIVSGIAFNRHEAKIVLRHVPDEPGMAAKILGPIGDAHIEIDMIVQNMGENGKTDFSFTVHRRDYDAVLALLNTQMPGLSQSGTTVEGNCSIAKITLVGVGMRSHAGIASKMFQALGKEGINIQLISTSEIKVSVVLDEKYLELGVRALHDAFKLHEHPIEE